MYRVGTKRAKDVPNISKQRYLVSHNTSYLISRHICKCRIIFTIITDITAVIFIRTTKETASVRIPEGLLAHAFNCGHVCDTMKGLVWQLHEVEEKCYKQSLLGQQWNTFGSFSIVEVPLARKLCTCIPPSKHRWLSPLWSPIDFLFCLN
jgi:hypothetical protein